MRNHYAVAEIDEKGRLHSLTIRIDDTMYVASPHDGNGVGARKLFMNIDTRYLVHRGEPQNVKSPRLAELEKVRASFAKRYRGKL